MIYTSLYDDEPTIKIYKRLHEISKIVDCASYMFISARNKLVRVRRLQPDKPKILTKYILNGLHKSWLIHIDQF